jgi:hypothetical protein
MTLQNNISTQRLGKPRGRPKDVCTSKVSNGAFVYSGIDRIDSSAGYSNENVAPCCKDCNQAKWTKNLGEYKSWLVRAYNHLILEK